MALTIAEVKNAKARDWNYELADSRGLHLLVITTGGKSWRLKYRYAGQEKPLTIGRYPDLASRERVQELRKLLRERVALWKRSDFAPK